jgi:hypothetical protein
MGVPAGTTKVYVSKILEAGSLYYIKVSGGDIGDYSFTIHSPVDDCGNTKDVAGQLQLGNTQTGRIDYKKDVDYWAFTTNAQTEYKITIENSGQSTISVELYDSANVKQKFQYSSIGKNRKNETSIVLTAYSTYYLAIKSNYDNVPYTMLVEPITDDYANDWEDATSISARKTYKGVIASTEDSDWLCFKPSKSGKYTFKRETSGVKFDIYRYDDGDLLKVSSACTNRTVSLVKGQLYYIRLYTTSRWKSYNYTFNVTRK